MKTINLLVLIILLSHGLLIAQSEQTPKLGNPDSIQKKSKIDSSKNSIVQDSTKPLKNEIAVLKMKDSMIVVQNMAALNDSINKLTISIKAANSTLELYQWLIYGGFGLSFLLFLLIILFKSKINNRINTAFEKINQIYSNYESLPSLSNKFSINERKLKTIEDNLASIDMNVKNSLNNYLNKVIELDTKFTATQSFKDNVTHEMKSNKNSINQMIIDSVTEVKSEYYIVEYFVEGGIVKFRESNHGTPFYIQEFKDKSELTINEDISASSNYSESIQRCFEIKGPLTGKYKNIKPARCNKDDSSLTWKLIEKGSIESY